MRAGNNPALNSDSSQITVAQCISINQNFANSATIANIYANLLESLERVEDSIRDILPMLQQRLGGETAFEIVDGGVTESVMLWEVEWVDEVQKVLEMDAGWGLKGFWDMVLYNLKVNWLDVVRKRPIYLKIPLLSRTQPLPPIYDHPTLMSLRKFCPWWKTFDRGENGRSDRILKRR
jgi:hypothetical protein